MDDWLWTTAMVLRVKNYGLDFHGRVWRRTGSRTDGYHYGQIDFDRMRESRVPQSVISDMTSAWDEYTGWCNANK